MKVGKSILSGATAGIRTWSVYGVVEFLLACIWPILFEPDIVLLKWQWGLIAMLLGAYTLFGLIIGSACGACIGLLREHRSDPGAEHQIVATFVLAMSFVLNLMPPRALAKSEYVALAIAILLASLLGGSLFSQLWLKRTIPLANPWITCLLLLGCPWLSHEPLRNQSNALKLVCSLLMIGGIIVVAYVWRRRQSTWSSTVWVRTALVGAGFVFCLIIVAALEKNAHPFADAISGLSQPDRPGRPNVVVITMDTVRADHLSVYGYERDTTPQLRAFAQEATVYNRAMATADYTLPTHASIFTGLYPSWHGAYATAAEYPHGRPLGSEHVTLAEVLASDGYFTAAVVANHGYLQRAFGMDKGFADYEALEPVALTSYPSYIRDSFEDLLCRLTGYNAFYLPALRASDINRRAFALLDRLYNTRRSFFLFLNYMDAHFPYAPPRPFNTRFPGRDPSFIPPDYADLHQRIHVEGSRHITVAEKEHLISQYDGGIAYLDQEIGKLLIRLRDLGLYENTLIIVTADHGEAFGEKDHLSHGDGLIYQVNIHIPLIVKYARQHAASQSDALASQIDVLPTVLDSVGLPFPSGIQGRSLRSPRGEFGVVYAEGRGNGTPQGSRSRYRGLRRAIFSKSWKLSTWTEASPELFDLSSDPGEEHNLYSYGNPQAAALSRRLASWVAVIPLSSDETHKTDGINSERLRTLGYLQ